MTSSGRPTSGQGEVEPLALAAGEGAIAVVGAVREADLVEDHAGRQRRGIERGEEPDGFEDPHLVVEVGSLEHDADPGAQRGPVGPRVEAEDLDRPLVRAPIAFDDLDRRRLAGAVRSEHGQDLAACHGQVEPIDDRPAVVALDEALR